MDEDDEMAIGFARVKVQNERLYEALPPEVRVYMEAVAALMVTSASPEQGFLPHHGAIALMAWMNKNKHLSDDAVVAAIAFCVAIERWEQARAGL